MTSLTSASRPSAGPGSAPAAPVGLPGWQVWAGQAGIALGLTVIAAVRAAVGGASAPWTLAGALVFGCWFIAGTLWVWQVGGRPSGGVIAGWWLVGLGVIWTGALTVSVQFVWLAFPLWLLAGLMLPWRPAVAFSVVVFAGVVLTPVLDQGSVGYPGVIGPAVGGLFALGASRAYLRLVRDAEQRRELIASLRSAQRESLALADEMARMQRDAGADAERTRLSRDIHDTVAQAVSSIGMLARAALETGEAGHARRVLEQIDQLARDGLTDTRRIVNALMPAELESAALPTALRRMLDRLRAEAGIDTELRVDGTIPALSTAAEVALLRTAQSALANVRAHARANRVVVTLADAEGVIRLDITDDGQGFDTAGPSTRTSRADDTDGGYGLRAMRERLRELGGGLDVETAPGQGTALAAHLPMNHPPINTAAGST
jgi:signal transduction histidine kinase